MSRLTTSFVLGYHGCDREVGLAALHGDLALTQSDRDYDWLGPGIYFWESDPVRALEWAKEKARHGAFDQPFVIGAIIDLRNCLNLLERENLELLALAHASLVDIHAKAGLPLPENKDLNQSGNRDKLLRFLDCAVIRNLHAMIDDDAVIEPFDTVRGLFVEGAQTYPGSGFNAQTHTQIAVRNESCIRGIFLPRDN